MSYQDVPSLTGGATEATNIIILNVPCTTSVAVGDVVYINPSNIADQALADTVASANALGTCEVKISTTVCNVRVLGVTGTFYTGLDPTLEYYLSDVTPGAITTTPPTLPGHVVLKIGQPFSDTRFFVLKGPRLVRE
jgi:hypothetical protein